jgi:hypothetical protein
MKNKLYGRAVYKLLLSSGLGLSCVACEPPEQTRQQAPSLSSAAAKAPAATQLPNARPIGELELLAAGDSIGPRPLEVSKVGESQLRVEPDPTSISVDTINRRFLVINGNEDTPQLFYRASPVDTTWLELNLFAKYEHGGEQTHIDIQEANLDAQGRPEALITYSSASYGSGGGTNYASTYLLDMTPPTPLLLLQASTSFIMEAFPGYAAMHGDTLNDDFEEYQGFERTVQLRPREVIVGRVKTQGRHPEPSWRDYLTALPAGRYRYQHGRMYLVKNHYKPVLVPKQ